MVGFAIFYNSKSKSLLPSPLPYQLAFGTYQCTLKQVSDPVGLLTCFVKSIAYFTKSKCV